MYLQPCLFNVPLALQATLAQEAQEQQLMLLPQRLELLLALQLDLDCHLSLVDTPEVLLLAYIQQVF
jgi:hypothetical protein